MHTLRQSARRLLRSPLFTLSAVGLLGVSFAIVGAAATVAVAVLRSPLPYAEEGGLVTLYWAREDLGIPDMSLSLVEALELPSRSSAFEAVAATHTPLSLALEMPEGPAHVNGGLVTPEAFDVLGLELVLGRGFRPDEGVQGTGSDAVVLSHAGWQRLFGGVENALGATIDLNGRPRTVVGVLPPGTTLAPDRLDAVDVWLPMGVATEFLGADVFTAPTAATFRVSARLRAEVTFEELRPELSRVGASVAEDYPDSHAGWDFRADPLRSRVVGSAGAPVTALFLGGLLFGSVALVNLIALFRRRSVDGARAMSIRRALGATHAHLRNDRLADGLTLGATAAVLAAVLVQLAFVVVRRTGVLDLPAHVTLGWTWPLALALPCAALLAPLFVGMLTGSGTPPVDGARLVPPVVRGWRRYAPAGALGVQIMLGTTLTVGAAALLRSWEGLRQSDTGVNAPGVLTTRMDVPRDLMTTADVARGTRALVEHAREQPGVEAAWIWSPEVPTDAHTFTRALLESAPGSAEREPVLARYHTVSPGAVEGIGLRIVAGRDMTDADQASGRRVAIVSASAAAAWWGSAEAALGQRMRRPIHTDWSEVIGVVADAPLSGRFGPGSDNTLDVFFVFDQDPRLNFLVIAKGDVRVDEATLRSAAAIGLPAVPMHDFTWLEGRLRDQERHHRSAAALAAAYAVASLALAAIGIVAAALLLFSRTRAEVGLRQALGGTRARVVRELLAPHLAAIALGVFAGSLVAREGLSWIDPVVLTVGPDDLASHLAAATLLGLSALVALLASAAWSVGSDPARTLATLERP